jgi:hypothetical protein
MRMPVRPDVFGLLPPPPIPPIDATDTKLPEGLTRVIRALEERLNEAKTTDTSLNRVGQSAPSVPDEAHS